jgi:quercetin dioxygenase-like cupin family protein
MVESQFLCGKVIKRSLPEVQPPFGPEAPDLKRLMLPQGELAQFFNGEQSIQYIAYIELQPGNARGNHYHKTKAEWVYLIQGTMRLLVQDVQSNARDSIALSTGDLVFIQIGVAHALEPLEPGQAIEFSSARFDPADIYKFTVARPAV